MPLRIEWRTYHNDYAPIVPASVTLADPDGVYGVRRLDTYQTVVASGTAMATSGLNVYYKEFDEPQEGLNYEYYVRVVESAPFNNIFYVNGQIAGSRAAITPHTLGWCRKMLVDISGRFDLVVSAPGGDYTDNGLANWYINAGQQRLDNLIEYPKSVAWLYKELAANDTVITFKQARFIKNVYEQDAITGERTLLPWSTLNVGLAPEQVNEDDESITWTNNQIMFGEHYWHNAIYLNPSESARLIVVEGSWYSRKLMNDSDRSFWTCQHPHLLVRSAMREMEVDMRNSSGVEDFDRPLIAACKDIYHNLIAEEMAGPYWLWRMT